MATADSPASPQWDNRTRPFLPPSQLQHIRQASPLSRELSSFDRPRSMTSDSLPTQSPTPSLRPPSASTNNHTRSSSFFSFLKSNDNTPSSMPSRRVEPISRQSQQLDEHGRLTPEKQQQLPPT